MDLMCLTFNGDIMAVSSSLRECGLTRNDTIMVDAVLEGGGGGGGGNKDGKGGYHKKRDSGWAVRGYYTLKEQLDKFTKKEEDDKRRKEIKEETAKAIKETFTGKRGRSSSKSKNRKHKKRKAAQKNELLTAEVRRALRKHVSNSQSSDSSSRSRSSSTSKRSSSSTRSASRSAKKKSAKGGKRSAKKATKATSSSKKGKRSPSKKRRSLSKKRGSTQKKKKRSRSGTRSFSRGRNSTETRQMQQALADTLKEASSTIATSVSAGVKACMDKLGSPSDASKNGGGDGSKGGGDGCKGGGAGGGSTLKFTPIQELPIPLDDDDARDIIVQLGGKKIPGCTNAADFDAWVTAFSDAHSAPNIKAMMENLTVPAETKSRGDRMRWLFQQVRDGYVIAI